MTEIECSSKEALTADIAKKVAARMRKNARPAEAYHCRTCGHWHVGGVLTGQMRRVKFDKIVKRRRRTRGLS